MNEYLLRTLRAWLGYAENDNSHDDEIAVMTKNEQFAAVLSYEGIIGYGTTIRGWIKDIYGVDLDAV